jgi:hypothetical protein
VALAGVYAAETTSRPGMVGNFDVIVLKITSGGYAEDDCWRGEANKRANPLFS